MRQARSARSGLTLTSLILTAVLGLNSATLRAEAVPVPTLDGRSHVRLHPCADDGAWRCGAIDVPLDRSRPHGRQLRLHFRVLPHSDPNATPQDPVFSSDGGPGLANSASYGFQQYILGDLTDERDLVLVDHRGTGRSGAIDCPRLQQIIGDTTLGSHQIIAAIAACGRQLGRDADRYGSGDVAMDLDAVREALGYRKISLYGLSYAGAFASAYATRFPEHLRTVVIDAGVPVTDPRHAWTWGLDVPSSYASTVALDCQRAPACSAAQPHADSALARLADRLRRRPVTGAVDGRDVTVDEPMLVGIAADVLNQGELAAAASALRHNDPAPLLRLGAEQALSAFEPSDPREDSAGDNAAAFCNDTDFVWDRSDPFPVRREKYRAALDRLGLTAFAPFSSRAWTDYWVTGYCLRWPAPDRFVPAVPAGASVTGVPTLIISGDIDTQVPTATTRELLRVFPEATFVPVAGAIHPAGPSGECAMRLVSDFIREAVAPDPAACPKPAITIAATSAFPTRARDAGIADADAGNAATEADLRVVTAAVQTARDAWLRSYRIPGATGALSGLRGGSGTFDYAQFDDHALVTLDSMRFAEDVAVSGSSTIAYADDTIVVDLDVTGPNGLTGHLHGEGGFGFGFGDPFHDLAVTGEVGHRQVHASVPAN